MTARTSGRDLVQPFASGLLTQAILSASNFLAGWMLIRHTSDIEYGYYMLVFNALLLLTALQGSYVQPQLVVRVIQLDAVGRADLVGGLMQELRALLRLASCAVVVSVGMLWLTGFVDQEDGLLIVSTTLAATPTLMREFLRMVLFAYRRPQEVLGADACYVVLSLVGVILATTVHQAAAVMALALAAAAWTSTILLSRAVSQTEGRSLNCTRGALRAFAPLGTWSVAGAAAHWALSQGYSFLVAGTLNVQSVAAIAATRLLLMPLNVVSGGLSTQLFPLTADWVHSLGVLPALRRLALISLGLVTLAAGYFAIVWLERDWIFSELLHKDIPQRDALLLLWGAALMLMLVRDQLVKLLAARQCLMALTSITVFSAVLSLAFGYVGILRFGEVGAVSGIVFGELANIVGIVILTLRELKRAVPAPA